MQIHPNEGDLHMNMPRLVLAGLALSVTGSYSCQKVATSPSGVGPGHSGFFWAGPSPDAIALVQGNPDRYTIEISYYPLDAAGVPSPISNRIKLGTTDVGLTKPLDGLHEPPGSQYCQLYRRKNQLALMLVAGDGGHTQVALVLIEMDKVRRKWMNDRWDGPVSTSSLYELFETLGPENTAAEKLRANHAVWTWIDKNSRL